LSFVLASFAQYLAKLINIRYHLPYWVGVFSILIFITGTLLCIIALLFPIILTEGSSLLSFVVNFVSQFELQFINLGIPFTVETLQSFTSIIPNISQSALGILGVFGQLLAYTILVLVLAFYIAIDNQGFKVLVSLFIPSSQTKKHMSEILDNVQNKIGRWALEQITMALIIGIFMYTVLTVSGVKYGVFLSLLTVLFELIPFIGPIIMIGIILIYSFSQSVLLGIGLILLFVCIQIVKHTILVPVIESVSHKHNPILLVLGITIGGITVGALGVIIATPIISLTKILYNELSLKYDK
jgi:predicted PurR-regulated permease PerM